MLRFDTSNASTTFVGTLGLPILVRFVSFHLSQLRLKENIFPTNTKGGILDVLASLRLLRLLLLVLIQPQARVAISHTTSLGSQDAPTRGLERAGREVDKLE